MGLIRGEPPTIFGDGKNIMIHRDEDSDREHHGDDTCNDGNAPATSIPSLPPPAPKIQVSSNSGAADDREEDDIAICAQEGGEDDGDEEMEALKPPSLSGLLKRSEVGRILRSPTYAARPIRFDTDDYRPGSSVAK